MSKELRDAAKHLKQQENITVRRADKTPAIVLIDTEEYKAKLDNILADETKFRRIRRNPVDDIKREANGIIERINALSGAVKLPIIRGDFEPGYIYGNVKTHKANNPLRPIISQIPTPTYRLAKKLNSLLTPYIPSKYRVQSSTDFLDIVRRTTPRGVIASLDVESLFTNVPVQETIDLICDKVYRDTTSPPLDIPEDALKQLLRLCTMSAPFRTHRGELYTQVDGVAMGSPLGVLFADFYMGVVEERVFSRNEEPHTYCRYVDDTFVQAETFEDVEALRRKFEEHSSLRFTSERSDNGTLPFLDVLLTQKQDLYTNAPRMRQDAPGTQQPAIENNTQQQDNTRPGTSNNTSMPLPQRTLRSHTRRFANRSCHTTDEAHINTSQRVLRSHTRNNINNTSSNTNNTNYTNNNTSNHSTNSDTPPTNTPNTNHTNNNTHTHTHAHTHAHTHTHTHTHTQNNTGGFDTSVYRKPTNMGLCLNGLSECPARYKKTAMSAYIRRALSHCSSWKATTDEVEFASQMLVDNGYSNTDIHSTTRHIFDKWYTENNNNNNNTNNNIKLFYRNQFHSKYRQDEKALRDIISDNVKTKEDGITLNLIIYYSNKKTVNLILKNNPSISDKLKKRNVVYSFTCPLQGCPATYIGMTTTTLSKRLSCHVQEGNIYNHFINQHNVRSTRAMLIDAIDIVDYDADPKRLRFLEALHIANKKPSINVTQEPLLLPSCT